jgi:hypothetical protein
MAGAPASGGLWLPAPGPSGAHVAGAVAGRPQVRHGKRAFLRALAQQVRGASAHDAWQVPRGRAWLPEEWESARRGGGHAGEASGTASAAGASGVPSAGPSGDSLDVSESEVRPPT